MAMKLDQHTKANPKKQATIKKADRDKIVLVFKNYKPQRRCMRIRLNARPMDVIYLQWTNTLANGQFDKCKSPTVQHVNEQDSEMCPDKSSPTVTIHKLKFSI